MVVQHNLTAMNANRYLGINNSKLSKSLEKLSSGYAINRAGDNAAGLAVSEKMRSQIAGMTQGVKNAQDGISMVQTFEGALTETHSILQRMKTLADQMANGSYDDPVDRTAAQQEFLQLNDELDQIADTDFNGVVVLNGGQMADGTKAVNGKFDYNAGVKAPTKLGKNDVNVLGSDKWDDTGIANGAWKALNSAWTRQTGKPATNGPESVDITFQYDKTTSKWKAISANNGANINNIETVGTTNGGFTVQYKDAEDNKIDMANVVMDQTVVSNGDTITLTFNNPSTGISAPTNATAKATGDENFTAHDTSYEEANNLIVAIGSSPISEQKAYDAAVAAKGKADTALADARKAAVDALLKESASATNVGDDDDITTSDQWGNIASDLKTAYNTAKTAAGNAATALSDAKDTLDEAAATPVTDTDMTEDVKKLFNEIDNATFTATYGEAATVATDFKITLQDGTQLTANGTAATEFVIGNTTFAMKTDATTGVVTIEDKAGTKTYFTIGAATNAAATNVNDDPAPATPVYNSTGTISWDLGIDQFAYDNGAKPTVEVAKTGSVSKSDAFNKSEAILTYKDNITLQVGARTKDAVNFTFQYASTSIGDLKDDLDCTSRGLGTNKLNINTQESANYAIDKIDQAINKVSLIRGTFGAIQNRLEHKIDNMNVSIENLTSAESQIRDTNMPQEMMNFTKQQILAQASQSMLAQANQLPQGVLSLLQ